MRLSMPVVSLLLLLTTVLSGCSDGSTGAFSPADTDGDADAELMDEEEIGDIDPDPDLAKEEEELHSELPDSEAELDTDVEADPEEYSETETPDTACVWDPATIEAWPYYPYHLACEPFPGMSVLDESPGVWRSVTPFPQDPVVPTTAMIPLDDGGLLGVTFPSSVREFSPDGVLQKQTACFTKGRVSNRNDIEIAVNVSVLHPGYPDFFSLYGGIYEQDGDGYRLSDPEVCIDGARICSHAEDCESGEMMGNHYYKLIETGHEAYPWITFSRSGAGTSTDRILLYDAANAAWRFEPISGLPVCAVEFTCEDGEQCRVAPDPITGIATRSGRVILTLSAHETYWAAVQPDLTTCGEVCSQVYELDLDTLSVRPLGFVPGAVRFIRRNSEHDDLYLVWHQPFGNSLNPESGSHGIARLSGDELVQMPVFDSSHGMVRDVTHLPGDRLMALSFKGHVLEYQPNTQQWRLNFSVGSDTEDCHASQMIASVPDNNLWIDVMKGYAGGYRHMTPEGLPLDRGVHSGIQGIVESRLDGPLGYGAEIRDIQQDDQGNLYLLVGIDNIGYQTNLLWVFALVDDKLVLLYESIPLAPGEAAQLYVDDEEIIIGFGIGILHLRLPENIVTRRDEPLLTEEVFLAFHRQVRMIATADDRLFATSQQTDPNNQNLKTFSLYYYQHPEWHMVAEIGSFDDSVMVDRYSFYDEDFEEPGVMWLAKRNGPDDVHTLQHYSIDTQSGSVVLQQEIALPTKMYLTRIGGELQLYDAHGRYHVRDNNIESLETLSYIETLFTQGCLEALETPAVLGKGVYDCIDDGQGNPLYMFSWHEGMYIGRWNSGDQTWDLETAIPKVFGSNTGYFHRLKCFGNRCYYYGSRSNLMEYTIPQAPVQ